MAPQSKSNHHETSMSISVHRYYHIFFLYIEPIAALLGAIQAGFYPAAYLSLTDRQEHPSDLLPVATNVVLRQLANMYLLFALNEALVLRATDDLRVWRVLLFNLLVADLGHLWSVLPLGTNVFWETRHWNKMDWGNVAFVYQGITSRIAFLVGIGVTAKGDTY